MNNNVNERNLYFVFIQTEEFSNLFELAPFMYDKEVVFSKIL